MSSPSRFITPSAAIRFCIGVALCLLLASCSGGADRLAVSGWQDAGSLRASWPQGLPEDAPQPWEKGQRGASDLDDDSEFLPGVERFLEAGDVVDLGEASRLQSGQAGSGELAWAMYRLELSGQEPGVLALDINLLPRSDGSQSSYFVGLSDYSGLRWEWHGPYSDNHVRLARASTPGPDVFAAQSYLSGAGNSFATVVAFDGNSVDVLGLSAEALNVADTQIPPVPSGLTATAVAGGLSLQWNEVIASDLAGYRVYYSSESFFHPLNPGVVPAGYVEGSTRFLLTGITGNTFVQVSAIDHNGNESSLSNEVSATPLAGNTPGLTISLSRPSVLRNELASLEISTDPGLLLDYDLDGDGNFEVTGSTDSSQDVDTAATGIIRPRVRASSPEGDFQAYGGVSLIVAGNSRPVANGLSSVSSGPAPLQVDFSAPDSADLDGSIVGGGWDFDGDGIFDAFDPASTDQLSVSHTYNTPGLFNAKLRVIDDQGAFDVDTISILVEGPGANLPPVAQVICDVPVVLLGQIFASVDPILDASASYDPEGGPIEYAFDLEGDGFFTSYSASPTLEGNFTTPGNYLVAAKVRDSGGLEALGYCMVRVMRFAPMVPTSGHQLNNATSITALDGQSNLVGIAYNNSSADDLLYLRSTDKLATDWQLPVTVDSNGGEWMSLAQVTSQFNLAYYRDGDLFFKASQNDGTTFNVTGTPDNSVDDAGNYCSCAIIGGRPAIAYHNATSGALYFVRAANSSGSGAWDPPILIDDTGNTGQYTCLISGATVPLIAYYRQDNGNLLIASGANFTGSSWNSPVIVDGSADDVGRFATMQLTSAFPAIVYYNATATRIQFIQAQDVVGTNWDAPVIITNTNANSLSFVKVNGYPTIFYAESASQTRFIRSVDFNATQWGQAVTIEGNGAGSLLACTVVNFDGLPMLSYYDSVGLELHFTRPRLD